MKVKIDELDKLVSEYIRRRAIQRTGGCERCLTPKFDIQKENGGILPAWKQLQCSHFIGRSNRAVRYDSENLLGLCMGCHLYLTAHPLEHVEFFEKRLGDRFELLQGRARIVGKPDKEAIKLYFKKKIEDLV